ncbi:hypothetical protein JW823_01180 [bacterium]|nr:hypothetical protein [candidate division CSSED10-310 bacterium]
MAKVWEEKDNVFLQENYLNYSNQDLADMFGVTKKSIQGKLRRLGLHRKEDGVDSVEVIAEDKFGVKKEDRTEEKPLFRKKRLNCRVPKATPETLPPAPYRPVELTEKRKRAIREFDNAIKIMSSGDKDKAREEFRFIREHFPKELDIVQRSESWIKILSRQPVQEPVTAQDYYIHGVESVERSDWASALDAFRKAVELDPEYLDAEYNIACILCRQGEHEKSLDILWHLAEINDRFIEIAIQDDDFEPIWQNQGFIDLAKEYIEEDE